MGLKDSVEGKPGGVKSRRSVSQNVLLCSIGISDRMVPVPTKFDSTHPPSPFEYMWYERALSLLSAELTTSAKDIRRIKIFAAVVVFILIILQHGNTKDLCDIR